MKILPVLDLLGGHVVRGIGGRRNEYRPIVSRLTKGSNPLDVARALRNIYRFNEFYVADLDGILKQKPDLELYRQLIADGFQLLVDAGITQPHDAIMLQKSGVTRIVTGLETCRSPGDLARITECSPDVTFSLDLVNGIPRYAADADGWSDQPAGIVQQVIESNVRSLIVLDLSDVGMGTGGTTDAICQLAIAEFPGVFLIAGGGIRGCDDLRRLQSLGVNAALVASALHDGRLDPDDFLPD